MNGIHNVDFSQVISDHYSRLTKSEKRIADFLRKNQEESAFMSAGEIASRLGLSEATMVRFARTLGFDSYPAMRTVLQENFRQRVTHSARLRSRLDELRDAGDIFEKITAQEIDYLTQALATVDRQAMDDAVDAIRSCEHLYVYGTGPSTALVDILNVRLTRFGIHVIPLALTGQETLEPLLLMTDRDLLFAIGFFDVNPTLKIVLDHARSKNCPAILLTDTLGSVIGDRAQIVLSAKRGPVSAFHSLVVPMTIINALLLALSLTDQELVMTNLDRLDQLRDVLRKTYGNHSL